MTQETHSAHRRPIAQSHLGDQGELWFAAALPVGWVWQPPRRDFGKDGLIVIRDGTELHNLEFSVQIKSSTKPRVQADSVVLSGVPRSSVRYWFASPLPTLVVAVDLSNRTASFAWHQDLFDSPDSVLRADAPDRLTITVPKKNRLDHSGWQAIRADLFRHFRSLQRALTTDSVAPEIISAMHCITRVTGNLIRLGATAPPEPPLTEAEGIAILIEQLELRDAIHTVRILLARLPKESDVHSQVDFWLKSFEATAYEVHPTVRTLPPQGSTIPPDFELGFAPKRLLELRPSLVRATVDLLMLMTSPGPSQSPPRGDA